MHPLARCLQGSEKPERSYFWGIRMLKKGFPYKLMVPASLLYTISAYERFHRNALLSGMGANLALTWGCSCSSKHFCCRGLILLLQKYISSSLTGQCFQWPDFCKDQKIIKKFATSSLVSCVFSVFELEGSGPWMITKSTKQLKFQDPKGNSTFLSKHIKSIIMNKK